MTVRFTFGHLTFEVPEGIEIVVDFPMVTDPDGVEREHVDFNFVRDGEVIAMLGGTDEDGDLLPSWEGVGIRRVGHD